MSGAMTVNPVADGSSVTYQCKSDHVSASTNVMSRQCTNGNITPDPVNGADAIICYQRKLVLYKKSWKFK